MDPIAAIFANLDPVTVPLGAIVTFVIFSLLRGWLMPASIVKDRMDDKDKQLSGLERERDDWKEAATKSSKSADELQKQNGQLLSGAEATNRLLESLRINVDRQEGPSHHVPPTNSTQKVES